MSSRSYGRLLQSDDESPGFIFLCFWGMLPLPVFCPSMFSYAIRCALFCFVLVGVGSLARGGMTAETPYTDRGKADFDTALQLLNPWGNWSKIDGKWAFTPSDHEAPYTDGRWIYTEYGWYWKGTLPHSWVTEHYGYWKRGANKVWSWFPGPFWLPQIVEIRATTKYIGWRTGEVDDSGSFVEAPIDRYSKSDEWTFVTLEQFANPVTPALIAPLAVAKSQLEDSTDCRHTYLTYREIDRPGPHPADFTDLCRDGKMLAPGLFDDHPIPTAPTPTPALTNAAAAMTGTNAPSLIGTAIDPSADTRKVKYWVTMSLPTYWTAPPADAKAGEIYLYRPDFYQDQDGIERRITLWFNPLTRTTLKELLGKNMPGLKPGASGTGTPATPASPAVPAESAEDSASNPFRSPLDERFKGDTVNHAPNASTKAPSSNAASNAAPTTPAPSGLAPSGPSAPKIPAPPAADGVTPP